MRGCSHSASPMGNNVRKAMPNSPSILYSLIGDEPIVGHSNGYTGVDSIFSTKPLISSTSLCAFSGRATKEEGWE